MNILSYNPGHDGAIAYLKSAHLMISIEAEKNSQYRYSPISSHDVFDALGELEEIPDVLCTGGWWANEDIVTGSRALAGYRGLLENDVIIGQRRVLGRQIRHFSSSHERSHLLCAFGMSSLPKGTPCYALIWEGAIGAFYEIDSELNITLLADVMNEPGNRYGLLYGLADPTFPKDWNFSRNSDAGKLMALASFSVRHTPSADEVELMDFLLQDCAHLELRAHENLSQLRYHNVGVDDPEFRNFAGILSDKIFDVFYQFAKSNLKKRMPLLIAGGCGLNCDWNTKWRDTGFFTEVFVPPVANDSGSAIGTAIDAQFHVTGNPKIDWNVYSGLNFITAGPFDSAQYDVYETNSELIADILANDLIVGWVNGKYEIGPRALGNRSILAAPFHEGTRVRNEIKQREQFRPIAPVCLEEESARWFGCDQASPFMLYTHRVRTDALAAVTHVNGTARIQTVSSSSNRHLYELLVAFKARTGYGVLCNTSLNFKGRGFINKLTDLSAYAQKHNLDGFVVEERTYLLKSSRRYQEYLRLPDSMATRSFKPSMAGESIKQDCKRGVPPANCKA
jgi:predicted NodU family carbamoyl transferase